MGAPKEMPLAPATIAARKDATRRQHMSTLSSYGFETDKKNEQEPFNPNVINKMFVQPRGHQPSSAFNNTIQTRPVNQPTASSPQNRGGGEPRGMTHHEKATNRQFLRHHYVGVPQNRGVAADPNATIDPETLNRNIASNNKEQAEARNNNRNYSRRMRHDSFVLG